MTTLATLTMMMNTTSLVEEEVVVQDSGSRMRVVSMAAERALSELYGKYSSAVNRDGFAPRESEEKAIQRFLWARGFTWVQLHLRIHAETQEWSFANRTVPDLFSSFLKEGLQ